MIIAAVTIEAVASEITPRETTIRNNKNKLICRPGDIVIKYFFGEYIF